MPWASGTALRGGWLVAVLLWGVASCAGDDTPEPRDPGCAPCPDAQTADAADQGDGGDGDGDGDEDSGIQVDAGDAPGDAGPDAECCNPVDPDVVGVSFQQLWPRTAEGQTSPHMHLTGLLFLPGDRGLLLWEKVGRIAHYRMQGDELELLGELRLEDVLSYSDCGLSQVALDPEWESNHYVYATHCTEISASVLVRYEFDGVNYDVADSRALVLEVGEERATKAWHSVTGIGFFNDAEHSMWVLSGEKNVSANAQDLSNNLGKVLRIIPRRGEGSAGYDPHPDNPFAGDPMTSSGPDIYAWGLRSPWRGSIDRRNRLFIGDVGGSLYEEVNVATEPGQNFGWSTLEGPCRGSIDCTGITGPIVSWPRSADHRYRSEDPDASPSTKRVVWAGIPYEAPSVDRYRGFLDDSILFSDMCIGFVRALSVDDDGVKTRDEHVGSLVGLTGAAIGPDGYLYVTSFGSCAATSGVGGGIFRVLPREAEDPLVIEPPQSSEPLVDEPLGPMPEQLSQTGIFADAALTEPIERAIRYAPNWPLWSNGSEKDRWLLLPEGGKVDNGDRLAWDFPPGTLFFKTFTYEGASIERIETRIIRRTESGYDYNVYKWNDAGTDATLMSLEMGLKQALTLEDGTEFQHVIPSRFDCRSCHESNPTVVIGFDELRLNTPLPGESETQLAALDAAGIFEAALPQDPDAVSHADPSTQQVLGYLHGNCAHCHNESARTMSPLSLDHHGALERIVNMPTEGSGQASGIRVVPQSPETSVLFLAFSRQSDDPDLQDMPPIGVSLVDEQAAELLRSWIDALPVE
jgi:hypothetical protein